MIEVLLIKNVFAGAKHAERFYVDRKSALVVDLLPPAWYDVKRDVVPVRGVKRLEWDDEVLAGDRVAFVIAPRGIEFTFIGFLKYLAIMFVANVIIRSLMPKPPKAREDNSSATYGFNGIEPNRIEGEPIPMYYGEMRVGGQIINEYVEDYGALGSSYLALVSLGEGPLQEVAGQTVDTPVPLNTFGGTAVPEGKVFLNDTDVTQLQEVEVSVRLGTLEQLPIEGFELASSIISTNTDLATPTTSNEAWEEILSFSQPWFLADGVTASDATFDASGIAYSATVDADAAVVKILYPEGAGYIDNNNVNVGGRTGIAVRYIRLDGSGSPITTGGPFNDGYVYLRPFRRAVKFQSGASIDLPFSLYNPATFALGAITGHMSFNGGGSFQVTIANTEALNAAPTLSRTGLSAPPQGPNWTPSAVCDSFTVECFFFPRNLRTPILFSGAPGTFRNYIEENPNPTAWLSFTGGAGQGFAIGNKERTYVPQAGQSILRRVPYVSFGGEDFTEGDPTAPFSDASYLVGSFGYLGEIDGNVVGYTHSALVGNASVGTNSTANNFAGNVFFGWQHLVATYQKNASGALSRVRLFVNGVKLIDRLTATQCTLPSASGTFTLRGPGGFGYLKNVAVYKGVMSQQDILTNYNNGNGRTRVIGSLFPVAIYQSTTIGQDDSGNGNTLANNINRGVLVTIQTNGAVIESGSGAVASPLRARYKVEVLRAFKNVTATRYLDAQRYTSLRLVDTQPYSYPTAPLIAVTSRANSELNGQVPRLTSIVKGRKVPVWDGTSTGAPTFNVQYSSNPAWVVVDMLLNKEWGLGNIFDPSDLDIGTFQEWADHCDELIYNQSGYVPTYSATTSGNGMTWYDMYYDSVNSQLVIICPLSSVPDTLQVGDRLVVTGFPTLPSGVNLNDLPLAVQAIYNIANPVPPFVAQARIVLTYTGAAPWATYTNLSSVVTPAGTWTPKHERFSFDGAVDQAANAWDTITQVAACARASVIRDGRRIRVAVHKPRPVVQLVGNSQILQGTFEVEYLNPKTRFNQIEIAFLDEALNYERSMVSLEHQSIGSTSDAGLLRRKSFFQEGVTRRAQILRQARLLLNQENEVRRKGRFVGSIDLLDLEPMDVIRIAHDVVDRGVSGRIYQTSTSSTQIYLDRTVVLAAATTYKLSIRSGIADAAIAPQTLTVTSSAGSYGIGSPLTVSGGFTLMPQLNDVYTLVKDGEDLLAQIESISLTADFQREITWSEYVESVYDVEGIGDTPDIGTGMLAATSPALGQNSIPPAPDNVLAQEVIARSSGGTSRPRLLVTWQYDETSSDVLGGFDIYVADSLTDNLVIWEMRANVSSGSRSVVLDIENAAVGNSIAISVVARSKGGQARTPDRSSCVSVRLSGRSSPPAAPQWDSDFARALDGEQATYRFQPGSLEQSATLEIRRGCWLLGQRVGSTPQDAGKFGPTTNWTSVASSSIAALHHLHGIPEAAEYQLRAVSENGKWSAHDSMTWSPMPVDSEVPFQTANRTFFSNSWEDFGIGWRRSGLVTPNATLTGCQVTTSTLFPQGYLEFSGSNLTATYTTADPLVEVDQRAEWFYNSAFCVAEQIWPTTWAVAAYPFDDVEAQWTWEGPLNTLENGDDPGRVSLKIEFRTLDEDDTYSAWQAYSPGKVRCQHVQWRLSFTRPTTSYQIRIYRFSTELLRIPRQRFERSGIQYFAEHQIFGRT